MAQAQIELALITDEDNIYYLTGYYNYLHMEFGRPTILVVSVDNDSILITPEIDLETAKASARVDRIAPWNDGAGAEWREELPHLLSTTNQIAIEPDAMPAIVKRFIEASKRDAPLLSITPLLSSMRMIKTPKELQMARHAGEVANCMMEAGKNTIADGAPEFEVALATAEAGTRKAAALLGEYYADADMSPNIHFLQIMASGDTIVKTHHRASTRIMRHGEPVFLCFCGMTNFHRFKLGFDRTFWIGEIPDPAQQAVYEVALASQQAALDALRPGVTAESVHAAYAEVIQEAGYDYPFRCGRATGFSYLEKPQLVTGDTTMLQAGMVLAVDGCVATPSFRAQIGDSVILTETGYEPVTSSPKNIEALVIS